MLEKIKIFNMFSICLDFLQTLYDVFKVKISVFSKARTKAFSSCNQFCLNKFK